MCFKLALFTALMFGLPGVVFYAAWVTFGVSIEMAATASVVSVNLVMAAYATVAYFEDEPDIKRKTGTRHKS